MTYYLYEVTFAQDYSICIRSTLGNAESFKNRNKLSDFLTEDISNFGEIVNVVSINYEEANRFFDLDDFDNWPVFN